MTLEPHFIAADAGTSDSGPFCARQRQPNYPRESIKHDMAILLVAARRAGIPMMIGSSGTAGIDAQVDLVLDIANEIAVENSFKVRSGCRLFGADPGISARPDEGAAAMRALEPAPHLDEDVVQASEHVVGMMGVEPLQRAIAAGAELVIAGRCSDSALFAAIPIMEGLSGRAGVARGQGDGVRHAGLRQGRARRRRAHMTKDSFTLSVFGKGLASDVRRASPRIHSTRMAIPTSTTSHPARWT